MESLLQELKDVIDSYGSEGKARYGKSISPKEILLLEKHLNIIMPKNLHMLISTLGVIDTSYGGVFGIYASFEEMIKEEALIFEVHQEERDLGLPKSYYIIDDIDDGGYTVLDCSKENVDDGPVQIWEQGFGLCDGYPSFKIYLENLLEALKEDELGLRDR